MVKWLVITFMVLTGFMLILLGLGYLLNENEKSTTVLKTQIEQADLAEQEKQEKIRQRRIFADESLPPHKPQNVKGSVDISENIRIIEEFEQVVISNLTCISVQQCQVAKVSFKNTDCFVAINNIGVSLLSKLKTQSKIIAACPKVSLQATLSCQQNICSFDD